MSSFNYFPFTQPQVNKSESKVGALQLQRVELYIFFYFWVEHWFDVAALPGCLADWLAGGQAGSLWALCGPSRDPNIGPFVGSRCAFLFLFWRLWRAERRQTDVDAK